MNRIKYLSLLLGIIMLLSACVRQNPEARQENGEPPETGTQSQTADEVTPSVPVTDPAELDALWREYLYDSITSIGNAGDFDSPGDIDPYWIASFCYQKLMREQGDGDLEADESGSGMKLLPLETVLLYARRYFNITQLNVSKLGENNYRKKKNAFIINFGYDPHPTAYNEPNAWSIKLAEVTKTGDGTVTALLSHSMHPDRDLTDRTDTYVLRRREDGSLYFASGKQRYINNHLVTVTGEHRRFDAIDGYEGRFDDLTMLGEENGRLILVHMPAEPDGPSLMLVDPETMKAEKIFEIDAEFSQWGVSTIGKDILIRLEDKIIILDRGLTKIGDVPLPEVIKNKIKREVRYNKRGIPDIFFGGYDLSADRKRFAYSDETGLWLYDTESGTETLLAKTVLMPDNNTIDRSFHRSPRFVADGARIITTMTDYEGTLGYTVCDIQSKKTVTHKISGEASSSALIRYDTGILEPEAYMPEGDSGSYKTVYLDFALNTVSELAFEENISNSIRMPYSCFTGQNYAVFSTCGSQESDYLDAVYTLHRVRLSDLKPEPGVVSVSSAEPRILGVLADGRIVFTYHLNPAEAGICITK